MPGECHYLEGNLRADQRIKRAQQLLDEIGLGGERVAMFNLSAAMGARLAEIATQMTEKVRALGTNPLGARDGTADRSMGDSGQDEAKEVQ